MEWYDGHLDLACLALEGRDMLQPLSQARGGPQPPGVTFPSLQRGNVRYANATLFTAPNFNAPFGYPRHNIQAAHRLGVQQLKYYQGWQTLRLLRIVQDPQDLVSEDPDVPLKVVLLMEGADPIQHPDELAWWFAKGLRIVGLSWVTGTRYAGGNKTREGLSSLGRQLVTEMDRLGMIHDLSHLSDNAARDLLEHSDGPVLASHSNSRTLLQHDNQRHLTPTLIEAIAGREGVVGINLLSRFLTVEGNRRRARIDEVLAHIEAICDTMGHRRGVALGSDMDGGFGADQLPQGIDQPADYRLLWDALAQRGWSDDELRGFACNNWLRTLQRLLPPSSSEDAPPTR